MSDESITLIVDTTQGVVTAEYSKTTKISEVIQYVISKKELANSDTYSLTVDKTGEELDKNRTIVSYQLTDNTELTLTDIGVAV